MEKKTFFTRNRGWYYAFLTETVAIIAMLSIIGYRAQKRGELSRYLVPAIAILALLASTWLYLVESDPSQPELRWYRRPSNWCLMAATILICLFNFSR